MSSGQPSRIAIALESLGHAYDPGHWIFRHYSARIETGRVVSILGPNGRGKTTLLRCVLGQLTPSEGTVRCHGRVAFVPQLFHVTFDYSALDMVLMGRASRIGLFAQPTAEDEQVALRALERFGLAELAGQPFHALSGGQRQLVIFARSLVTEPDVLVLDEPTSSLDYRNQSIVLEWIARLSRENGLTVVFSTHQPQHALAVSDSTLLMTGRDQMLFGPAAELLTEENLLELYGVPLKRLSFAHAGRSFETLVPVLPSR